MGDLDLYRKQHRELLGLVDRLGRHAEAGALATSEGAHGAHRLLVELSGRLLVHLQMEDRSLYPSMLASHDEEVRAEAARFQGRVGQLRATFDAFSRRWLRPSAIEAGPHDFAAGLRPFLHALTERIAAEDAGLFPLVERPPEA